MFVPSVPRTGDGPTSTLPSTTVTTVEFCARRTSNWVPISTTYSRSGDHPKWAMRFVGDFEARLAGRQCDKPFGLTVANRDRTFGIQVQYRIIRQTTAQLFPVTRLKA